MSQPYIILPVQDAGLSAEWNRIGCEYHTQQRFAEAERAYHHALRADPRNANATQNLAVLYAHSGRTHEGLLAVERAHLLDPKAKCILINWAFMAVSMEMLDLAIEKAELANAVNPCFETRQALAMVYGMAGFPELTGPLYAEVLKDNPVHPAAGPNSCFIQTLMDCTPADLAKERAKYREAFPKFEPRRFTNDRNPDRPLRVGYVSGDFKTHSAAYTFGSTILGHSERIIPYLYSCLPVDDKADPRSAKFKALNWREIENVDPDKVCEMILEDQIDILVDLAAHTCGGRLDVFMRKPAPIQITAWGFAHGTGLPEMDYFFADPVMVPKNEREHYTETIWDLPCAISYAIPQELQVLATSPLPFRRNGYITFGAFARYEKFSDACLGLYAEILRKVPDARILFKDAAFRRPFTIRRVARLMGDMFERCLFLPGTPHDDHMLAIQDADLILDPLPHSGGVGAAEQLAVGVPLVTLYGRQPAGRVAAALLTAAGHSELIARTKEEYVKKSVELALNPARLESLRKSISKDFTSSPAMEGYTEAVEQAYFEMFRTWATGEKHGPTKTAQPALPVWRTAPGPGLSEPGTVHDAGLPECQAAEHAGKPDDRRVEAGAQ